MPYIAQQSPWLAANNMGETFSRLMVSMAMLKNQQAREAQNAEIQQAQMAQQQPLIDAQVERNKASAGFDTQRTAVEKALMENSRDTGVAAFGRGMAGVPGYNPNQTSMLQDTPETRKALMNALFSQGLATSAATSPTASASLLRPIEANQNTSILDAITGAVMGHGPVSPERPVTLAPGAQMFPPTGGQPLATNTNVRPTAGANPVAMDIRKLEAIGSILRQYLTEKGQLEENSAEDSPRYNTVTNNIAPLEMDMQALLGAIRGTNTQPEGASAPSFKSPPVGTVSKGYRFKGGDPADKNNWEKLP